MNQFTFDKTCSEAQRDAAVLTIRKDGFTASRETNTIRTNATLGQACLSIGNGFWFQKAVAK